MTQFPFFILWNRTQYHILYAIMISNSLITQLSLFINMFISIEYVYDNSLTQNSFYPINKMYKRMKIKN